MSWSTLRLGDIAKFKAGNAFPKEIQGNSTGDFPFAKVSDMNISGNESAIAAAENWLDQKTASEIRAYLHPVGSVAFAKIGIALTYNRRRKIIRPTILDNNMMSATPDPSMVDADFFFHLSKTIDFNTISSGSALPYLTAKSLKEMEVKVPSRDQQERIAALLDALDDKIELNCRMNETLEKMARALFRDWFVDFGPTCRQIEGATDPAAIMGHAFPPEKAATLAPAFPNKLGDDGLPEGWRHGMASDQIDFNPKEPLKKGTSAPYSDMASLPTSGSLIASPVARDFKSGMRFRNGDALIARITPCLENGKAGFVDYLTEEAPVGWGSTEFFVLRSKPHVAPQFAYCLVRDPDFRKRAEQSMTGTSGRQRAQIEVLKSHEMAVPDDTVHAEFGAVTMPFFEKIKANGQEIQILAEMRDLLLPKLMSGEIRLKSAEAAK